jgi:hypothetical protein
MSTESDIARICQSGYDRHIEDHGPDGSVTFPLFETPVCSGFTVKRDGKLFTVTVSPAAARGEQP